MVNLDQVLSIATDIVPLKKLEGDRWAVAVPLQGEIAKHYFKPTIKILKQAGVDPSSSDTYHSFDGDKIRGSSTNFCTILQCQMRPDGFYLLGVPEARILDKAGKLSGNFYSDLGMAVYSDGAPNQETAQAIIQQAAGEQLPFVLSFRAMDYALDNKRVGGIALSLAEEPIGIITGEDARRVIEEMNYPGNSGACGVYRDGGGYYYACWLRFDNSNDNGLVGWICAEGARSEILRANEKRLKRKYANQTNKLRKQIQKLKLDKDKEQEDFQQSLTLS